MAIDCSAMWFERGPRLLHPGEGFNPADLQNRPPSPVPTRLLRVTSWVTPGGKILVLSQETMPIDAHAQASAMRHYFGSSAELFLTVGDCRFQRRLAFAQRHRLRDRRRGQVVTLRSGRTLEIMRARQKLHDVSSSTTARFPVYCRSAISHLTSSKPSCKRQPLSLTVKRLLQGIACRWSEREWRRRGLRQDIDRRRPLPHAHSGSSNSNTLQG
jgi:hypothetical protein